MASSYRDVTLGPAGESPDVTSFAGFLSVVDDGTDYVALDQSPRCIISGTLTTLSESFTLAVPNTSQSCPVVLYCDPANRSGWGLTSTFYLEKWSSFSGVINLSGGHARLEYFGIHNISGSGPRCLNGTNASLVAIGMHLKSSYECSITVSPNNLFISTIFEGASVKGAWYQHKTVNCLADTCGLGYDSYSSATYDSEPINDFAYNCTESYSTTTTFAPGSTNNAATDGATTTPPGANPLVNNVHPANFVNPVAGDFTLASGSVLDGAGADMSTLGADWKDYFGTPFEAANAPIGPYQPASAGVSLSPDDVDHAQAIGTPTLTVSATVSITAAGLSHAQTLETPALSVLHTLASSDLSHAHALTEPILQVATDISPDALLHGHTLEIGTLLVSGSVVPDGLQQAQSIDSPTLLLSKDIAANGVTQTQSLQDTTVNRWRSLVVADIAHGHILQSPTLATLGQLGPAQTQHGQTISEPTISVARDLTAAVLDQGQTLDGVTLSLSVTLTVQEITHIQALTVPLVSTISTLAISDLSHAHALTEPLLSTGRVNPEIIAHNHTIGSPTLTGGVPALSINIQYVINAARRGYIVR